MATLAAYSMKGLRESRSLLIGVTVRVYREFEAGVRFPDLGTCGSGSASGTGGQTFAGGDA